MVNRRSLASGTGLLDDSGAHDLFVAAAWAVSSLIVGAVPPLADSILRAVLGFALLVFIPGYAILAMLLPRHDDLAEGERIAIAIGLSVMTTAFVGLVLAATPLGLTTASAGPALAAVSIVSAFVGWRRRSRLRPDERYRPPVKALCEGIWSAIDPPAMSALERRLAAVLALSVVGVVAVAGYVALYPHATNRYTEFYILAEGGDADAYPQKVTVGENLTVVVGIANHEGRPVAYTVEAFLIHEAPDGGTAPGSVQRLEGFDVSLEAGETAEQACHFATTAAGRQRLVFLLFPDGAPPDDLSPESRIPAAYRELHLWLRARSA